MATTSWISFGPDLEPIESELRREVQTPSRRIDGIRVAGSAEDVAARLVEAAGASAGWCRFEQVHEDGRRSAVYVNGNAVRVVIEDTEAGSEPQVSGSSSSAAP